MKHSKVSGALPWVVVLPQREGRQMTRALNAKIHVSVGGYKLGEVRKRQARGPIHISCILRDYSVRHFGNEPKRLAVFLAELSLDAREVCHG